MLSSLYSGISGLLSNSDSLNVVGNNIANVNTIGYKQSRATFQDVLYQTIAGTSGTGQVVEVRPCVRSRRFFPGVL